MEGIFQEFENENSLRSYPFAGGCSPQDEGGNLPPPGLFIDAAIYPVNPSGTVYLSEVSEDGTFSVSDGTGVIMEGRPSGNVVEMYDISVHRRHVGTLVASSSDCLSEFAGRGVSRSYSPENAAFASGCVFPVVIDGVISVSAGESGAAVGTVGFLNGPSDDIRVSSGTLQDGRKSLRFDVLANPAPEEGTSIRRIICVVDGKTPFRIEKLAYNVILVRLDGIDREAVCSAAHRENSLEMYDACECKDVKQTDEKDLDEAYELLEVLIPPSESDSDGGIPEGSDNAFYLVVPNTVGYDNPLSITLEDGEIVPKIEPVDISGEDGSAELEQEDLLDSVSSKSVVIQVPGLSGGTI